MVPLEFIVLPFVQTLWFYPHSCSAVPGAGSETTFPHLLIVQISAHKWTIIYHLFYLLFSFIIYYLFYELSFATYQNLCCFWTASWVQEIKGVLPHCFSALTFCFHIIWGKHWQKHIWYQPCGVQKGQKTSSKNVLKCLTEIIFFLKLWLYFIIFVPV